MKASITNRQVTLTWELAMQSPAATSYAVDVALQPGGEVIATLATPADATPFSLSNVPPGNYYVRVRGVNAVGSSGPSGELHVVVH
ncbi:MAG TPA: hypothetical protein VMO26_18325 [Vicinamibacterales bacterium]|nr:hypothetical protein [Vicinamibacterales bacterium]